ncbi:MAG TPA: aminotransferase class IV, partial [Oligoflexia bacterium]|nr:aminotransferase class IV [Oligoflexia bacterium]
TSPRNIYTGCIGMLCPDGRMQFNVAIRTVTIDRQHSQAEYGVGGGITWDSTAAGEFEECRTKTLLLLQRPLRFSLLETILWTRADGYFLLPRHLQRLRESAAFFGFPLDLQVVLAALRRAAAKFPVEDVKVRLLLNARGALHLEHSAAPESTALLRVRLAAAPVQSSDQRLYHKTTDRSIYEEAQAACTDGSDVILWNEKGELTESANSNLVCELDGELVTPPLCCGLLPGTFRAQLLAEKKIKEGVVHRDDLSRVRRIYLINSVRLWREAALELLLESCANQVNVSPEFSPPTHSRPGQKTAAKSNNRRLPPQAEQTAAK